MALVFPDNPVLGQETITGGKTWRWEGSKWRAVGVTGYQGSVGYKGSSGETGYFGSVGYTGSSGISGYQGSQGAPGGPQGYAGSQGISGYTGSSGVSRLRDLSDVDIAGQSNGYLLTYVADSDKYLILPVNVSDTQISNTVMDGGTF